MGIYVGKTSLGRFWQGIKTRLAGKMDKSVYDANSDGVVDNAAKVNNHTVASNVPANAIFTDTTYTLTQDASDGHKITLTPSSGSATTITIPDNNTTYSSKAAASGGTDVSLVTTGEKYTWNNKSNLTIGTTATTAAAGNHTHGLSLAADTGTSSISLAANTKYKLTAGGSTYIFTTPPDTDTNTHRPIQVNGTEVLGNNTTALNLKAGTNVSISNSSGTVTITSTDTNTWRPVGTKATDAAAGNHTHGLSLATDTGTSSISLTANTKYKLTAGGSTYIFTTPPDNNNTYQAGTGLTLSGNTFSLSASGVTAGSKGPTEAVTGENNTQIYIPRVTVDTYGRVTALAHYKLTNKDTTYSNRAESNGGTAVSLVTTGDKYKWNHGISNILADLATVETSSIASEAYAVGDYLLKDRLLYKVTTAISRGGTLTPGTNIEQTTVGDELAVLSGGYRKNLFFTGTKVVATSAGAQVTLSESWRNYDYLIITWLTNVEYFTDVVPTYFLIGTVSDGRGCTIEHEGGLNGASATYRSILVLKAKDDTTLVLSNPSNTSVNWVIGCLAVDGIRFRTPPLPYTDWYTNTVEDLNIADRIILRNVIKSASIVANGRSYVDVSVVSPPTGYTPWKAVVTMTPNVNWVVGYAGFQNDTTVRIWYQSMYTSGTITGDFDVMLIYRKVGSP